MTNQNKFKETIYYCNELYFEDESVMELLYRGRDNNLMIYYGVPIKNRFIKISDPYFKIFKYREENDNYILTDLCRINMLKPEYIIGMDENMTLTNDELDIFMKVLISKGRNYSCSYWEAAVDELNNDMKGFNTFWYKNISNKFIPNYNLLKYKEE